MYFLETYYFLFIEQIVLLESQKSYPVYVVFRQCKHWNTFLKFNQDSDDDAEVESLCHLSLTPAEGSETDSDSMKDFIVEEEEDDDDDNTEHIKSEKQPQQKELNTSNSELLAYYIPRCKIKLSENSVCITCL